MTTIDINKLKNDYPLVRDLVDLKEVVWFNPNVTSTDQGLNESLSRNRIN